MKSSLAPLFSVPCNRLRYESRLEWRHDVPAFRGNDPKTNTEFPDIGSTGRCLTDINVGCMADG
jgi:hypothetical protein